MGRSENIFFKLSFIFLLARLFVNMVGGVSRLPYMMPDEEVETTATFKARFYITIY